MITDILYFLPKKMKGYEKQQIIISYLNCQKNERIKCSFVILFESKEMSDYQLFIQSPTQV